MKYSTWNKWDLHVHTRASTVKCGPNEYFGPGDSFSKTECIDFVDKIFNSGVIQIAITDHNYFHPNQFLHIKKLFIMKGGNALPGVEIQVFYYLNKETDEIEYPVNNDENGLKKSKSLHCIIVFNDDNFSPNDTTSYEKIKSLLNTLYKDSECVYIGNAVDTFLSNHFEFVLIPHFEKHKDLESVVKDRNEHEILPNNIVAKTNWIVGGFFSGLDGNVSKIIQSKIKAINFLKDNYDCDLPVIKTSDNHNYLEYSNDVSEYKALPTFNGLKLCFSDYSQRVRYELNDIEKNDIVEKIEIITKENSKIKSCSIDLSPFLNCIIGGRSSGKSLLLALMGQALGDRTNNHTDPKQKEIFNKFIDRYKKYNNTVKVKLLREDGSLYDGKIDIYLQDSIIMRFETNDSSILANDFKEEFNESLIPSIDLMKNNLLRDIKKLVDLADALSHDYQLIKSRGNIIPSLYVPIITNNLFLYNDQAKKNLNSIKADFTDLSNVKIALDNIYTEFSTIINKNLSIHSALQKLINIINKEYIIQKNFTEKYEKIFKVIKEIKNLMDKKQDDIIKQHEINRENLLTINNSIINYIKCFYTMDNIITKIESFSPINKTSCNPVGDYRFVVKYSLQITPKDILGILNSYRIKQYEKESLHDFVNSYISSEQRWSHSRTSEAIKLKIDEEINSYFKKEYLIYEKDELINEMSEGKKASVFIDILLKKDNNQYPIIIDQPEDNMDNNDITKRLVESLRIRKKHRQIVVVTHNANVVVNGDAENIIVANKNDSKDICYINSAIEYCDEFDMIDTICGLVEGGARAFLKREKKYGLEITNKNGFGGNNHDNG